MSETPSKGRRFQIEDALDTSGLHPICRHLIMMIARRINNKTGQIPDDHQPSITWLARRSGWSRSTVCFWLNVAERSAWLIRDRPPRHLAATEHVRTKYTITIPGETLAAAAAAETRDPLAELVTELLRERTGKIITPRQAGLVLGQILNGHQVRQPEPYIRTVISREPNPARWLPVAVPPTLAQIERELEQLHREEHHDHQRNHAYA